MHAYPYTYIHSHTYGHTYSLTYSITDSHIHTRTHTGVNVVIVIGPDDPFVFRAGDHSVEHHQWLRHFKCSV